MAQSHDGAQEALGRFVRERQRQLAQDDPLIDLVARGLFQHLHDEVKDEEAAQLGVEPLLAGVDVSGDKLATFGGHFDAPAWGGGPAQQLGGFNHQQELVQLEVHMAA